MENTLPAYDQLTTRQKLFVDHYITLQNATKACIEAGYSRKTAGSIGTENLHKPLIKQAIEERIAQAGRERGWTPAQIRGKIQDLAEKSTKEDTRLRALELLGKATPGTFEQAKTGDTFNLFALLGDLVKAPSLTVSPASAVDTTLERKAPSAPIYIEEGSRPSTVEDAQLSSPQERPGSPLPPPNCIGTNTDKISDQISSLTTPVVNTAAECIDGDSI